MDPERIIEKWLREYARKRRADAGGPLTPHPATRRMLQAEAARRAPSPDAEDDSVSLWQWFRQQWAVALGFALVVFFAATMLLPSASQTKQRAQMATEAGNLKQIGLAAQLAAEQNNGQLPASLDTLTNGYLAGNVLTDPRNGQEFAYVAAGKDLDSLSSNAVLAFSTADENGRAVLFADGRVEFVPGAQLAGLTNQVSPPIASAISVGGGLGGGAPAPVTVLATRAFTPASQARSAPTPETQTANVSSMAGRAGNLPAAPPAPRMVGRNLAYTSGALPTNSAQFVSVVAPQMKSAAVGQPGFGSAASNGAPVLKNFQMRQNGTNLVVVDGDGSIYRGSLEPGNLSFRAAGTNLTLKQSVAFAGNLLAISNAPAEMVQAFSANSIETPEKAPANQLSWQNLRVEGTAVIGTNTISIVAAPAPQ